MDKITHFDKNKAENATEMVHPQKSEYKFYVWVERQNRWRSSPKWHLLDIPFAAATAAAAAAKSLQSCPTLRPHGWQPTRLPSLGFSRQEHWSGLPCPSPMPESEKWKWSRSVVSDSLRPHGLQPTRLLRPWDFPGKSTGVGCHCLLRHPLLNNYKHSPTHL